MWIEIGIGLAAGFFLRGLYETIVDGLEARRERRPAEPPPPPVPLMGAAYYIRNGLVADSARAPAYAAWRKTQRRFR